MTSSLRTCLDTSENWSLQQSYLLQLEVVGAAFITKHGLGDYDSRNAGVQEAGSESTQGPAQPQLWLCAGGSASVHLPAAAPTPTGLNSLCQGAHRSKCGESLHLFDGIP